MTTLKWLITTHHHGDHYGAVPELVAAGFLPQVGRLRPRDGQPADGHACSSSYVAAVGVKRTTMTVGTVLDLGGGATG